MPYRGSRGSPRAIAPSAVAQPLRDDRDNLAVRRGNRILTDDSVDGLADFIQSHGNGNSENQYLFGDGGDDGLDNVAVRRGNQVLMDINFDGLADFVQAYDNGNSEDP